MMYELPTSLAVCGTVYEIRSDFRAALDICAALEDPDLDLQDKALVALIILYPGFDDMPTEHYEEAVKQCYWFIGGGTDESARNVAKLVSWEQDAQHIITPINRVLGREIRAAKYLHWWTFLSAFYEIGDCTFAQIVRIRNLKAKGKNLDKADQEWYRQNRHLVDFKIKYTEVDEAKLERWIKVE